MELNASPDPGEPSFRLFGRDRMAPSLLELWAMAREVRGEPGPIITEVRDTASAMRNELYLRRRKETPVLELVPLQVLEEVVHRRRATAAAAARQARGPITLDSAGLVQGGKEPFFNGAVAMADSEGGEP